MKSAAFRDWLDAQYKKETASSRMSGASRVEAAYGDLDAHFARDGLTLLIEVLHYSAQDEQQRRENDTKIEIKGDLRTGLASLSQALRCYARFRKHSKAVLEDALERAD